MHPALKLAASHLARSLPTTRRTVLYDSFNGGFADNPRALFELARGAPPSRPEGAERLDHVWSLRAGVEGPGEAAAVPHGSAAFAWAASRADVIVANSGLPRYFEPRRGARFVQTWHGTPLKRIGFDIAEPRFAGGEKYFQRLRRDVDRWDVLVSPNSYSTSVFRSAFDYGGRIVETGYPRNDILVGPDGAVRRTQVRASLGIPDSATAILYAPTWRDTEIAGGQQTHDLALEPRRLVEQVGEEAVLLLRLHPLVASTAVPGGPRVLNVSQHADMRELLLAADVLVTDYSSSMFDFAVTGKPLVFYAYDIDQVADQGRGFYFDLAAEAPGPVVRTEDELIDVLQDLESLRASWEVPYAAFRRKFAHLDDGRAGERVWEAVLADD